jgi:hypothetical protein
VQSSTSLASNDPVGDLNPRVTCSMNTSGATQLAQRAKAAGAPRNVFSSSRSPYGAAAEEPCTEEAPFNPVTPYSESKIRAEAGLSELADDQFSPTCLRNATGYGSSPRVGADIFVNNVTGMARIDNTEDVRFAAASGAVDLASRERRVHIIDLTNDDGLDAAFTGMTPKSSANWPIVSRPRGVPALDRGLADLGVVGGYWDPRSPLSPHLIDLAFALADLDPSVGAEHISAWVDQVRVCVTCGHSSAERVRTAADLVSAAGLNLQFGALPRTDVADESSGAGRDRRRPAGSPESLAPTKPAASSGGSPPSPLLRSTSQVPEAARSSSTQKSRLQ